MEASGRTLFTADCYGSGTDIFFDKKSGNGRRTRAETSAYQGDAMGTDLFVMPLDNRLAKIREKLEAADVGIVAYADDSSVAFMQNTRGTAEVVISLGQDLAEMDVAMYDAKTVILAAAMPQADSQPEFGILAAVGVGVAQGEGAVAVGVP